MSATTAENHPAAPAPRDDRYPAGIPYIVGNEGAERFSFYGLRAILYVYMAGLLVRFAKGDAVTPEEAANAKAHATEVVHLFMAGVYAFPLIGAVLSDRLLGKYPVIFWVSLVYCAGNAVMAVAGHLGELGSFGGAEYAVYIGLGLIAIGSGGIKPCVSANVGDQFTSKNQHLVTRIFQIFYFIINFGSFFSTMLTPLLYRTVGPVVAFGVPGALMFLATFVFWLGRRRFVHVPPRPGGKLGLLDTVATICFFSPFFAVMYGFFVMRRHFVVPEGASAVGAFFSHYWPLLAITLGVLALGVVLFRIRQGIKEDDGFLAVMVYSFRNRRRRGPGQSFFDPAREHFGREAGDGPPAVLRIMVVFSMVSVFWALFDQHSSTWIEQARQMNRELVMPQALGFVVAGAVMLLALFGLTWLLLHVSNRRVPRGVVRGVLLLLVAALATAGVVDAVRGEMMRFTLHPSQLAALNPLMVMIIIPLLNFAVWSPLRRRGIELSPLLKMTIGMFLAAGAFSTAALMQTRIESAGIGNVHALWQVAQYFIMTTSEVLVSITGLEFAYTQAPRSMKSTIMGFWLLCVTGGNIIVAGLAPLQKTLALSDFFWLFAALMGVAATLFAILARFYKGRTYLQS